MHVDGRILGTFALALTVLLVGLTGSASAALVGLERVSPATASTSSNKSITASCPAGKQLLGAGADVTPGNGHVLIEDITPNAALTGLTVKAVEDQTGTAASWFLQAFAICGQPPPGLQRVGATSASNSAAKSVVAACPGGKRVLGAGGDINTPNGQVLLDGLRPNDASVTLNALEDETGNTANWSLTAYAICANPVAGLQRVSATSASDSSGSRVSQVSCPVGKQVVGGGGEINSANGQVVADAFFPDAALTSFGAGAFEDDTGNPANWSLTSHAICANSAERVVTPTAADSSNKLDNANCPADKWLTGAGGEITGGLGQVALKWLSPFAQPGQPPPEGMQALSAEDDDGTDANWSMRAYAICATLLPGLQLVEVVSPSDNSAPKSVTASCPAGKRVVGAGGRIDGALGAEVAMQFVPNAALTSVTASGVEDEDGTTVDWSVTAKAVCATAPPGLQRVSATSELHSDGEVKAVSASCPAGKNVLGTGVEIPGGAGQVVLDDVFPNATLTRVLATGVEDQNGYEGDWSVTAYAICANP
jgi:hypothetical protein